MPNFTFHGDDEFFITSLREIRVHLTFSANCNLKRDLILKVPFSLPWPASMLLTSLSKGDRLAERKEYHFSNFSFSYRF